MSTTHLSVIVIDKHPLMRAALSTALTSGGSVDVVAEYGSVRDLLTEFGKFIPNMILFGIGNPGNDELAMLHSLRAFFPTTQMLVLVTGKFEGEVERALALGADAVLEKTVSRTGLLNQLDLRFNNHLFSKENANVRVQS